MGRPLRLTSRPGRGIAGADGAGDGELVAVAGAAELLGPADEVVAEHGAGQPGGVGEESSGGAALSPAPFDNCRSSVNLGGASVESQGVISVCLPRCGPGSS